MLHCCIKRGAYHVHGWIYSSWNWYIHAQILQTDPPVFSLNFSSADKGPFIAVEAKNIHQRCTFLGAGGSGVWDMAPPLLEF